MVLDDKFIERPCGIVFAIVRLALPIFVITLQSRITFPDNWVGFLESLRRLACAPESRCVGHEWWCVS